MYTNMVEKRGMEMKGNILLKTVTLAGKLMLENGAETYRVEETMVRILQSFDVEESQSFVTMTGIMFSFTCEGQNFSKIIRVQNRGVNLHKIDEINALARAVEQKKYTIEETQARLLEIEAMPSYRRSTILFFGALSAFGFALFFKGTILDAIIAFMIGCVIKFISIKMDDYHVNAFFHNVICAAVAEGMALCFQQLFPNMNLDTVIISALMLLVPGLAITNAIRDTVAGDYLAGIARATEAFLIAIAIASGAGIMLSLWVSMMGGM